MLPAPAITPVPVDPPVVTPEAKTNIISINELVEKDKQARINRAAKAIDDVLKAERVALGVSSLDFVDGRLFPKFALRATET